MNDTTFDPDRGMDYARFTLLLLSAVARMQGKRGVHAIIDVLRGSRDEALRRAGFDELPIFGLLGHLPKDPLIDAMKLLIRRGHVTRGKHRTLGLTPSGTALMTSQAPLDPELVEEIQTVFDDCLRRFRIQERTRTQSLELLQQGLSPQEIAQRRSISLKRVVDHLYGLARTGVRFDLSSHVDRALLDALRPFADDWKPGLPIGPIQEACSANCDWPQLKLHLIHLHFEKLDDLQSPRAA